MTAPVLCLVGHRRGCLDGARAAGVRAVVIARRPPPDHPALLRYLPLETGEPERLATVLATALRDLPAPAAVVPLAESTVRLAAHLATALSVTGIPPHVAERCTDKAAMKDAVRRAGLPCAHWRVAADYDAARALDGLGLPMVLKARSSSGGRGYRMLRAPRDLPARLEADQMVEGLVRGAEMSVESLVQGGRVIWRNCTDYLEPRWANLVPMRLPTASRRAVETLNDRAIAAIGIDTGIVHLELFRTRHGPVFGELACRPPGGYLMQLIETAWAFDPWRALFQLWLGRAMEPTPPGRPRCHAGVRVLHPGPGRVTGVSGLDRARAVPGVTALRLKVAAGDTVPPRQGSGQDVGCIRAAGPDRESVARALETASGLLHIAVARSRSSPADDS